MGSGSIEGLAHSAEPGAFADVRPDPKGRIAYRRVLAGWLRILFLGLLVFLAGAVVPIYLPARIGCLVGGGALAGYSGLRALRHVQGKEDWEESSLANDLGV